MSDRFVPHCKQRFCMFYSEQNEDCIYANYRIPMIVSFIDTRGLDVELFLNNPNCGSEAKKQINEYKMNKLLSGD